MELNGKTLAHDIANKLHEEVLALGKSPRLAIIQLGNDPASTQYVNIKKRRGEQIGIEVTIFHIPDAETLTKESIEHLIKVISDDTDGIILQLPLPPTLASQTKHFLDLIPQSIDVDGLNSLNLSAIESKKALFLPAVVAGVLSLIDSYKLVTDSTKILILGTGEYVGIPMAKAIKSAYPANTLVIADETTSDIQAALQNTDLTISCIGKPHVYKADQLKKGSSLIDVGTSKHPLTQNIVGDFDTATADSYLMSYTPVPGGVGPMTVISLLSNLVKACQQKKNQ